MNLERAIKVSKTYEQLVKVWIPKTGIKRRTGNLLNSINVRQALSGDGPEGRLTLSLSTIFYGWFLERGTRRGIKPYRFAYKAAKDVEFLNQIKTGTKEGIGAMFYTRFPKDKAPKGFTIKR
jgi:hypothetical protein